MASITAKHLAEAYAMLQDRIKDEWMAAGVTLIDPDSITIDTTVHLEPDVVIEPQNPPAGQNRYWWRVAALGLDP